LAAELNAIIIGALRQGEQMNNQNGRQITLITQKTIRIAAVAIITIHAFRLGAQPDPAPAAFEVASIRPHQGSVMRTGPLTVSSSLIRLEGYTVFGLVMDAYHLKDYQLAFGVVAPKDDIYDTMYDIVARTPGERVPNVEEVRAMLRTLLADRFKLKVHRESKEMPVLALVTGKNGPKLKASSPSGPCSVHVGLASDGRNDEETFSGCPIEELADRLRNLVGNRPVLNQTGLSGKFDFRLVAIPDYRTRSRSDPADISPITAVGELGLTLVPQKAPVDIIAVDHLG
jgi:uncharacterized protein (TIGR03435 family)